MTIRIIRTPVLFWKKFPTFTWHFHLIPRTVFYFTLFSLSFSVICGYCTSNIRTLRMYIHLFLSILRLRLFITRSIWSVYIRVGIFFSDPSLFQLQVCRYTLFWKGSIWLDPSLISNTIFPFISFLCDRLSYCSREYFL
jgi:hypothetical protein